MYRWVEHTGELELAIEAESEREVFAQGFDAMCELLGGAGRAAAADAAEAASHRVALQAMDRSVLLADWLGELAYLAETEGLVPRRLASLELTDGRLEAVVEGELGRPPHLVKAATYHRLVLESSPDGRWRASVVLDV